MNSAVNKRILHRVVSVVLTVFCVLSAYQLSLTETMAQANDASRVLTSLSLSLVENNAYLSVAHSPNLSPPNALTVEAWVKPFGTGGSQIIVDRLNQNTASGRGGYQLRIENGSVVFMICPDNLRARCVTTYGSTAVQPNVWQHVAATFETGATRVYLNGRLDGRRSKFVRSTGAAVGTLTIGANNRGGSQFHGLLDEIRICNTAIYQADFAPSTQITVDAATVGLWRFDSGTTNDSSSYNHPTTVVGNTYFSPDVPTAPAFGFRITPTPNFSVSDDLVDVVTIAPNNVWAVGSSGPPDYCCYPRNPVSLHWDGTRWNNVPVPTVSGYPSFILKSVDGNSSSDIWAIGDAFRFAGQTQKFLLRFNGTSWSFAAAINTSADYDIIKSISVINNNDIWIVGSREQHSWTMHWDGTSLTTVPSPNVDQGGNRLIDVDAISSNEVWAVGDFMAIRWNGQVWQVVPGTPTEYTYLRSVSVISPTNVWAVGRVTTCGPFEGCSSGDSVLNYNGTSWRQVSVGNLDSQLTTLESVSASAPDSVWVVGTFGGDSLILRFNGTAFVRVAAENPPPAGADIVYNSLSSVSALNANEVWTVGGTSRVFYTPYRNVGTNLALRRSSTP